MIVLVILQKSTFLERSLNSLHSFLVMRKGNIFLLGVIVISASEIIWQLYKKFKDRRMRATTNSCTVLKTDANEPKARISEVMFFSKDSSLCRAHTNSKEACLKDNCPARYLR